MSDNSEYIKNIASPFVFNSGSNTPIRAPIWKLPQGLTARENLTNNSIELDLNVSEVSSSISDTLNEIKNSSVITYIDQRTIYPNSKRLIDGYGTKIINSTIGTLSVVVDTSVIESVDNFNIVSESLSTQLNLVSASVANFATSGSIISSSIAHDINLLSGTYDLRFGDGSDGDLIVTGTLTLTRDMYYNNLSFGSLGQIITNGNTLYVKNTLDLATFTHTSMITTSGNSGSNAIGSTPGVGGATKFYGQLGYEIAGGNGGTSILSYNTPTAPVNVSIPVCANGGNSGKPGKGGDSYDAPGGIALSAISPICSRNLRLYSDPLLWAGNLIYGGCAGYGGSPGGYYLSNYGGAGGGGGSGGNTIAIYAKIIKITNSYESPVITNYGGDGGNGGYVSAGGGGGGGGGAGGAGWVYVYACEIVGTCNDVLIFTEGGKGGDGGGGGMGGNAGDGANGGGAGRIIVINGATQKISFGTFTSNPQLASGQNGGYGGTSALNGDNL